MSAGPIPSPSATPRDRVSAARATPMWRKAIPYLGTVAIFALIFWRIPIRKVEQALSQVPVLEFRGRVYAVLAVLLRNRFGLPYLGRAALQRADALLGYSADSREHVRARVD